MPPSRRRRDPGARRRLPAPGTLARWSLPRAGQRRRTPFDFKAGFVSTSSASCSGCGAGAPARRDRIPGRQSTRSTTSSTVRQSTPHAGECSRRAGWRVDPHSPLGRREPLTRARLPRSGRPSSLLMRGFRNGRVHAPPVGCRGASGTCGCSATRGAPARPHELRSRSPTGARCGRSSPSGSRPCCCSPGRCAPARPDPVQRAARVLPRRARGVEAAERRPQTTPSARRARAPGTPRHPAHRRRHRPALGASAIRAG